jgi:hypothetical protein
MKFLAVNWRENEMSQTTGIRMTKASEEDVEVLTEFLQNVEEKLEYKDIDYSWFETAVRKVEPHWRRVVFGFEMLLANAADPNKTYIDWKPEIEQALSIKPYALELAIYQSDKKNWSPHIHPEITKEWGKNGDYVSWLSKRILECAAIEQAVAKDQNPPRA